MPLVPRQNLNGAPVACETGPSSGPKGKGLVAISRRFAWGCSGYPCRSRTSRRQPGRPQHGARRPTMEARSALYTSRAPATSSTASAPTAAVPERIDSRRMGLIQTSVIPDPYVTDAPVHFADEEEISVLAHEVSPLFPKNAGWSPTILGLTNGKHGDY